MESDPKISDGNKYAIDFVIMINSTFKSDECIFRILSDISVGLEKCFIRSRSFEIPLSVTNEGKKYKLTKIYSDAFSDDCKVEYIIFPSNTNVRLFFSPIRAYHEFLGKTDSKIFSCCGGPKMCIFYEKGTALIEEDGNTYIKNPNILKIGKIGSKRAVIRKQVEYICSKAFWKNENLKYIYIPSSVTHIGDSAFEYCSDLFRLVFEEHSKLEEIGEYSFSFTNIKFISIPSSLRIIRKRAFFYTKLRSIKFMKDSKLESIEGYAFQGTKISRIDFPSSLKFIGYEAFRFCSQLRRISFPPDSEIEKIDDYSFSGIFITNLQYPEHVSQIIMVSLEIFRVILSKTLELNRHKYAPNQNHL